MYILWNRISSGGLCYHFLEFLFSMSYLWCFANESILVKQARWVNMLKIFSISKNIVEKEGQDFWINYIKDVKIWWKWFKRKARWLKAYVYIYNETLVEFIQGFTEIIYNRNINIASILYLSKTLIKKANERILLYYIELDNIEKIEDNN